MKVQYTPCSACGAVGEIGSNCQFCGTAIILKEGTTPSDSRLVSKRSISPQQYAERISIYQNVSKSCDTKLMYANIGDEQGIINLNGELVYPLQHDSKLELVSEGIVYIHPKYNRKPQNAIYTHNGKAIHLGELLNLETMEKCGNVEKVRNRFYIWESKRCQGQIDANSWDFIGAADGDRVKLALSHSQYCAMLDAEQAEKEAEIDKRRIEAEKQAERSEKRRERIKFIICMILLFLVILLTRMDIL